MGRKRAKGQASRKAPVTVGVLCPRVYLPSALEGWERGYVILHERAHIRWGETSG